jgi:DNA-binding MarR family transcriptional regulator
MEAKPAVIAQQLWDFVYAYDAAYERAAREVGLSSAQACLLKAVSETPCTMGELATRLLCDASNATQLVSRLEARDLVRREPQPGDGRSKRVVITGAGLDVNDRVRAAFAFPHERVGRLSADKQRRLTAILAELLN